MTASFEGASRPPPVPQGVDLFGNEVEQDPTGAVAERFGFVPYSVLQAGSGEWMGRKSAWVDLGIQSEIGRVDTPASAPNTWIGAAFHGTSVFDAALCESMYRWFCPVGGTVVDPFAGGSVRGVIAARLGLKYWGVELRLEQVDANRQQAQTICPLARPPGEPAMYMPQWVCGDSREILAFGSGTPLADFILTSPPYGDLEEYSDDPRDLSTMSWEGFSAAYKDIVSRACSKLYTNRFAAFVVGNFRDRSTGMYRDLVGLTVDAWAEAGAGYYNEAVLVTPAGSAAMRVNLHFGSQRKMPKVHQNVLVFCKGDPEAAARACRAVNTT